MTIKRTIERKAAAKRLEVVGYYSDVIAAHMGMLSVTDEVSNTVIEDWCRAIGEHIHVALLSEIAEG